MSGKPFEFKQLIKHPRERVYRVLRDEMDRLVPLLPNVESLEVTERKETAPGRLHVVNHWQGAPTSAPKALQPFFKPEMARWNDYAEWEDERFLVHWRFELPNFNNLFKCSGTNYFDEAPEGTLVRLTGTLTLYPENVPGVPKFVAKSLAGPLEKWVLGMVSPNLTELPAAVGEYLDKQG